MTLAQDTLPDLEALAYEAALEPSLWPWWFIIMERSCQVQLLAEASLRDGETLKLISPKAAAQANAITGSAFAGWFQFQPLYARIVKDEPDLLE